MLLLHVRARFQRVTLLRAAINNLKRVSLSQPCCAMNKSHKLFVGVAVGVIVMLNVSVHLWKDMEDKSPWYTILNRKPVKR